MFQATIKESKDYHIISVEEYQRIKERLAARDKQSSSLRDDLNKSISSI